MDNSGNITISDDYSWHIFGQSDKEMFDAQLISTLKDRVKELEDKIETKDNALRIMAINYLKGPVSSFDVYNIVRKHAPEALLPKEKSDEAC